jgi:hemoglobin
MGQRRGSALPIARAPVDDIGSRAEPPDALDGAPVVGRRDLADEDLHGLLVAFYDAAERDPLLARFFVPLDMAAHMPRIVAFWSTLLFHTGRYSGNAFQPHAALEGLTDAHFERWLAVLERTVDARFEGPTADLMKSLGHRIAYSMQVRLGIVPRGEWGVGSGE